MFWFVIRYTRPKATSKYLEDEVVVVEERRLAVRRLALHDRSNGRRRRHAPVLVVVDFRNIFRIFVLSVSSFELVVEDQLVPLFVLGEAVLLVFFLAELLLFFLPFRRF